MEAWLTGVVTNLGFSTEIHTCAACYLHQVFGEPSRPVTGGVSHVTAQVSLGRSPDQVPCADWLPHPAHFHVTPNILMTFCSP